MMRYINRYLYLAVFTCVYHVSLVRSADIDIPTIPDSLLCRRCGHVVAKTQHLINVGSTLALGQRNDTLLGFKQCLIQIFKNPDGEHFELITAGMASIKPTGGKYLEHSWFPGFAWRAAVCPQCGTHLGWTFEDRNHDHVHDNTNTQQTQDHNGEQKQDEQDRPNTTKKSYSFFGLIFPKLIQESYADSLIITPKAYRG